MDDQATESRTGALRPERTGATPFACADVGPGVIAMTSTTVVQRLTGRADIPIAFRFVSETLESEERTPLSVDTVAGPNIGSDVNAEQLASTVRSQIAPIARRLRQMEDVAALIAWRIGTVLLLNCQITLHRKVSEGRRDVAQSDSVVNQRAALTGRKIVWWLVLNAD